MDNWHKALIFFILPWFLSHINLFSDPGSAEDGTVRGSHGVGAEK